MSTCCGHLEICSPGFRSTRGDSLAKLLWFLRALGVRCHHVANSLRDRLAVALPTTPLVKHVAVVILRMARKVRTREGVTTAEDFPEGPATATHPAVTFVVEVGKEVVHVERIAEERVGASVAMVLVRLLLAKVGMAVVEVRPAVLLLVEVEGVVEVAEEVVHVEVVELRVGSVAALLEGRAAKQIGRAHV